ncbi:MAG TPA: hypothetical protein VFM68_03680 [Candidatus Saccharimonadales bacterium]|nr:hypothetical protein [Candidatus Saccharimonadales bacterium]
MAYQNFGFQAEKIGNILTRRHSFGPMAVGTVAAALAVDRGAEYWERRRQSDKASFITETNDRERSIYTLPGCRTDGRLVAEMLQPQFQAIGDTTFVAYPQKGFSLDSIKDGLLTAREKEKDKPASIYAISMGGLVLNALLADPEFRDNFGKLDTIVLDSSPSGIKDVRRSSRFALEYAAMFRDSWTMTQLAKHIMERRSTKSLEHEEHISDEQLRRYTVSSARTPLHLTRSQGDFIRKSHLEPDSLKGVADNKYFLHSAYDSVVNTDNAFIQYDQAFGGGLIDVVDESRPHGSHAAGFGFQRKIVDLLQSNDSATELERLPS